MTQEQGIVEIVNRWWGVRRGAKEMQDWEFQMLLDQLTLVEMKALGRLQGYTYRRTETDAHLIEEMIRPDGSVAVTAKKTKQDR